VNPGNSGGPLNQHQRRGGWGQLTDSEPGWQLHRISFAIPIDEATRIADQLKANGRVVRGYLGIQPVDVPRELAEEYGLNKGKFKGAFVRQVVPRTGRQGGIQPGRCRAGRERQGCGWGGRFAPHSGRAEAWFAVALQINRRGKLMDFKPSLTEMNPQITVGQELRRRHEVHAEPMSPRAGG